MRFRLEPEDMEDLYVDYRKQRERVEILKTEIQRLAAEGEDPPHLPLWPQSLHDYLNRRLGKMFKVRWYRPIPPSFKTQIRELALPIGNHSRQLQWHWSAIH